ncbi:hypothetical protein FHL15_008340 [Xylaria flabelliformis]|uniref:Protein kinase domain-containing protein n=1 Tax=Xylaria flabelliformis TaxID=2512241 RepID=A0A553HS39_9PEZI|nr:hypothetical protein FHL15_008340 [Xylaria flabelliformis]
MTYVTSIVDNSDQVADATSTFDKLSRPAGSEIVAHKPHPTVIRRLQKARRFPERRTAKYTAQMVSALRYLHRKHVIHRDIKPENVLVGIHGEIKMSDFGWSVHAPSSRRLTKCGTFDYLPPEMVNPRRLDKTYDEKVDLIMKADMTIPAYVSPEAKDLIRRQHPWIIKHCMGEKAKLE